MPPSKTKPVQRTPSAEEELNARYAPSTWGTTGLGGAEELQVPTGQLCLVRRPGVQGLIKAGVIREVDSLSALVDRKHIQRRAGKTSKDEPDEDLNVVSLMNDPKALENLMFIVDKVLCHCVIKPEVHMPPNDITLRKSALLYADQVDLVDKMFIFNFVVGGTRDLETFRAGLGIDVGSLDSLQDVPAEAQ